MSPEINKIFQPHLQTEDILTISKVQNLEFNKMNHIIQNWNQEMIEALHEIDLRERKLQDYNQLNELKILKCEFRKLNDNYSECIGILSYNQSALKQNKKEFQEIFGVDQTDTPQVIAQYSKLKNKYHLSFLAINPKKMNTECYQKIEFQMISFLVNKMIKKNLSMIIADPLPSKSNFYKRLGFVKCTKKNHSFSMVLVSKNFKLILKKQS